MKVFISTILIGLLTLLTASAQVPDSYYLPTDVRYRPTVPTPQQFLGYQVGDWHVTHDQLVAYMKKLDEVSDRITLTEYARTYENRPLLLLTVTSTRNHSSLETIRQQHLQLTDPGRSGSLNTATMPAVVWMGYSVHGNEASGLNAALLAAYYLAAAEGPSIDSLLNEAVVLLDPCINPDGANRFASWVNTHKSHTLVSDPNAREFGEAWPGGRTNHYWFDLNRDWMYMQHPESRGRMVKFHEWKPNLLTDHHEMGSSSTFFFQPGVPSRTHPLTPRKNIALTNAFGNFQATGLDGIRSFYYTQENYDDFYYGKGSTYPDVNGSVGILFEQASSRGHLQETANGPLSFAFTIKNQFVATLSTLRAARGMRVELLNYMRDFYKEPNANPTKAYVFGGSNDKVRTWEMVEILRRNQIQVYELAKDETFGGTKFAKDNAFVVPLDQPQHRLIHGIFEKRTQFEDSLFYDISAWSMPLTFNVPHAEVKTGIALGKKIDDNPFPKGRVVGQSTYAYLFEWDSYFAPRTLYELEKKGYTVKTAALPLTATLEAGVSRAFDFGTIQVQVVDKDPAQTLQLLRQLAERDGVDFYAVKTGITPEGIDLGSENFKPTRMPKALMLVGTGVSSYDAGEVWHLLDQRVSFPISLVESSRVNSLDLSSYTHLIMVSGSYGGLSADKVRDWVRNGGVLITMTSATEWAISNNLSTAKVKANPSTDSPAPRPYASAEKYQGAQVTGGAIFNATLDLTHPLAYGYKQPTMPVFINSNLFLETSKDPYAAPLIVTKTPLLSGYISAPNEKQLSGSPVVVCNNLGRGKVIAMTINPNFRAFWYGTNKLFLNALFFGAQISSGRFGGFGE